MFTKKNKQDGFAVDAHHESHGKKHRGKEHEPPFHMDMNKFDHWPTGKQKTPAGFDLDELHFPEF